jgi:asparagine synthase (glutamine-hydrolysing)
MIENVAARGPDFSAVKWADETTVLGHSRLSILDLSDSSNQPMESTEASLHMVYNGELYNYREIRRELSDYGVEFRTTGDTEVVLRSYEHWGTLAFPKFNGIFAVAFYNARSKELVLACDRFAVKPLYYLASGESIRFCSDFRALVISSEDVHRKLDGDAVAAYCALRYVPGDRTVLQGVRKLCPGEVVRCSFGQVKSKNKYWQPSFTYVQDSEQTSCDEILATLEIAVTDQTMGDVPYGVLLSGGIDSSAILALASKNGPRSAYTARYEFEDSICVPQKAEDRFSVIHGHTDESAYARLAASHCGATLQTFDIQPGEMEARFGDMVRAMGEPMASIDAIGHYVFASKIDPDIKFLLSGVGADEIFGGYVTLYFGENGHRLNRRISPSDYLQIVGTPDRLDFGFLDVLRKPYRSLDYAQSCFADALGEPFPQEERLNESLLLFVSAADLTYWELKQADAMYMAFSKEVRVPFLDNRVFDVASKIRSSLKWRNNREKYILCEALKPILPTEIINRKKFPSLGVPAAYYSRDWFNERIDRLRDRDSVWEVARVSKFLCNQDQPMDYDVLYRFVVLDQWLEEYSIAE